MNRLTRRQFGEITVALAAQANRLCASVDIDHLLRSNIERRGIPAVVAMSATADRVIYQGAFGRRDDSGVPVTIDSIFPIASMIKPLTSVAAMQMVEQGKLSLDEPASKYLPELGTLQVISGFDRSTGKAVLRAVRTPVTLRHLLTQTSGFAYDVWSREMTQYEQHSDKPVPQGETAPIVPLIFEPGTRWQYGYSADWTGRLVEKASGLTLEQYFERFICGPLGMKDTSFRLPPEKFDRLVTRYRRQPDGSLRQEIRKMPEDPKNFNGGGDLFSTAADYVKFMQVILRRGRGQGKERILSAKSVEMMATNQIGTLSAGKLKSLLPAISSDVDFDPGIADKFGFGFLINAAPHIGGRSAGSLAWAGIGNTYFWIDPKANRCAVLLMQFLPFFDREAIALLGDFERAVYTN